MDDRRSVLLLTEQIDIGGKRSHVEILKAGLEEIGWRVHLLDWASLSWIERAIAAGGYHVINRFSKGLGHRWLIPVSTRFFRPRIRSLLRGPDAPMLLHAQEPMTYFPARAEAGHAPVVVTIHGPISRELRMMTNHPPDHPAVRYMEWMEETAYRGADLVISVDRPHADYVKAFGRKGDVPVITNFVDTRRFHPRVAPAELPRELTEWLAGRPFALCPRRLVPKNGIDVAIRAARVLHDRGARIAIVAAGEGPQRKELEALAASLGVERTFRFAGEIGQDALPGWYRRADVVIVPSVPVQGVEEATSISALEGQAVGRPVVAAAIGGLPEIVENGVDGWLVPTRDSEALADRIERAIDEPELARRMGEAAAARVAATRSHRDGARAYAALYEAACGARESGRSADA
jgi:glycosyltransferase involved in cell wall biosynthesis